MTEIDANEMETVDGGLLGLVFLAGVFLIGVGLDLKYHGQQAAAQNAEPECAQ